MSKAVGIDLGTTNSVVAVVEGGQPVILENAEGSRITPSVVGVNAKTGERYVGLAAKRQAVVNPEQTVFSIKRLMGRKFEDSNVKLDVSRLPYSIDRASNGDAHVTMGEQLYSPPEVSAMVLQKLKLDAEAKLGDKVTEAVITVPAYFNDAQRQATKDAGRIAGLDVLRIINEPTAASLAYGLDKKTDATIAVFDLGGGTFDITILRMGEGVFEVLSTSGDTHLGGDDFDQVIMDWLVQEFRQETGVDLNQDRMALQRLREAAEKAKVELSSVTQTEINLPFISADHTGPKHLVRTLPRAKLEQLASELLVRIENPCLQALKDAEVTNAKVDEVILVGGMTRMPAVYEKVCGLFEKEPNKSVNPDEAVAAGAALQAAVLKGDVRDILLLDVIPLTVGLETLGGVTTALINRNTTIPSSKSQTFTTAEDNQGSVEIHVLQGERPMANANKSIGRFILDGILPAPRGVPKIEVTFDIDANGILSVQAKDEATGREQKIVIEASSGLSSDEIDRLIKDAEDHADEDRRQREQVDLDNTVAQMIYGAEKTLTDHAENIPEEVKSDVQSKISELRKAKESQDSVRIQSSIEQLTVSLQQIGAQAYGDSDPSSETSEGGIDASDLESTEDNPGESVEGEFREVDPDGDEKQK